MTAELRRGLMLAVLGLLLGLGLVAGLFEGAGYLKRTAAPAPSPEAKPGSVEALSSPAGAPAAGTRPGGVPSRTSPSQTSPDQTSPLQGSAADPASPTFDIVRVEPNGEAVVAGRGAPNTVVEMLVDGKPVARALIDPNGQFAIVPPALQPGNSEIVLRSTTSDGRATRSKESVAVAVAAKRDARPLVALTSPDKPTVVLSQPDAVAPVAQAGKGAAEAPGTAPRRQAALGKDAPGKGALGKGALGKGAPGKGAPGKVSPEKGTPDKAIAAVKIVSVDAQEGGRLYVTGQAPPGARLRLYLNDTLVAPASVGADGKVTFTIGRGVRPGAYSVRVDQVDAASGKVRSRAEVPFTVPDPAPRVAGAPAAVEPATRLAVREAGSLPVLQAKSPILAAEPRRAPEGGDAKAPVVAQAPGPLRPTAPPTSADMMAAAAPEAQGTVFVPAINTARITRGDSLWQISRRTYGKGDRYTVIYDANQEQIRNPDLIYPGQIFVLPGEDGGKEAAKDGGRG